MKKNHIIYAIIFSLIFTTLFGCTKNTQTIQPRTYTHFCFDTICNIIVYSNKSENEQKIIDQSFKLCDDYDIQFDKYKDSGDIGKINKNPKQLITVSKDTLTIVKDSLYYSKLSEGAFDITISPLSDLWNIKKNTTPPKEDEIKNAVKKINYKNIQIKNNKIKLKNSNTSIDLGAIAKGYVADKLKIYLKSNGITSAIINLGGNILTIGNNISDSDNPKDFKIGIQKPFSKDGEYSARIYANDKSVVTSGIYERYFKYKGKIYHHILNPSTGYPADNNLFSVTIISNSSEEGDALSTTAFLLGLKDGLNLINSTKNVYAVFITKDYKIHLSKGLTINSEKEIRINASK